MPSGIYIRTEEHKRKIGLANSIALKGKKLSEEHKEKISESNKGKHKYWLGKKMTDEHKAKIGKAHKNHPCYKSVERSRKLSEALKGNKNSPIREKNNFWNGGISFEPYTIDWTNDLKRAVRKRDKYTCQICGKEPATHCHHIDYDKKNCNPNNLIILCPKCHGKTNINRDYWTNYFKQIVE